MIFFVFWKALTALAMASLPLPELWRHRTPSSLVSGVALLGDEGGGVCTLAQLLAPGATPVEGLTAILFPSGLPARPLVFSTVMTDSFTHRTFVGVQISYQSGMSAEPSAGTHPHVITHT